VAGRPGPEGAGGYRFDPCPLIPGPAPYGDTPSKT